MRADRHVAIKRVEQVSGATELTKCASAGAGLGRGEKGLAWRRVPHGVAGLLTDPAGLDVVGEGLVDGPQAGQQCAPCDL